MAPSPFVGINPIIASKAVLTVIKITLISNYIDIHIQRERKREGEKQTKWIIKSAVLKYYGLFNSRDLLLYRTFLTANNSWYLLLQDGCHVSGWCPEMLKQIFFPTSNLPLALKRQKNHFIKLIFLKKLRFSITHCVAYGFEVCHGCGFAEVSQIWNDGKVEKKLSCGLKRQLCCHSLDELTWLLSRAGVEKFWVSSPFGRVKEKAKTAFPAYMNKKLLMIS